jgi:hypothetical protein
MMRSVYGNKAGMMRSMNFGIPYTHTIIHKYNPSAIPKKLLGLIVIRGK